MDKNQLDLLIEYAYKHFGDDTELLLETYPLTGPNGIRRMLGFVDQEYFCRAYLSDQFDREFGEYAKEILHTLSSAINSTAQEKIAVVAPREHGKALDINTPILTTNGWAKHGELEIGDYVFNQNGESVRVLHVQKPYLHECMRLSLDTGDGFICSKEHEWIIEINRDKRVDNKRNGKRIGRQTEILETQNIFKGYQVDSPAIRLSEPIKGKYADLPIEPYLLGAWLGDGHSAGGRICCGRQDIEHFKYLGKVQKSSSAYNVAINGICHKLKEIGVFKNKHIPEIYLCASYEQRLALLNGLMDTDGTVNKNRAQCAFTNTNKRLAEGVLVLCRSLGIKAKMREKDAKIYGRFISKAYEIGFTASKTDKIFRLERKQTRIDNKTKAEHIDKKRYFIKEIVEVGNSMVNCISVEGGIYLAGNGLIPTHNSTLSTFATPTWASLYKVKNFIFFISANGDTSANFLEKTKKALETPDIVEDFGVQRGRVWNADNICLRNGVWIACTGWKAGIRGINKDTRPDLIILDDLEDKSVIESESLRKKLDDCFRSEIGRLGYYKTDFFYIGTLLSDDSLLARVTKEPSWKTLFYKCVTSFPEDEHLWEEWRKIYRNILNENREHDAYEFYLQNKEVMTKGAKVLWEGRFPEDKVKFPGAYYNVMLEREAWGEDAFWKEAQNEPRNSKDKKFQKLMYWDEYPKIEELKLAIDPSEGKGDYTAYACVGEHNGGFFVKEGMIASQNPYQIMDETVRFVRDYPEIDEIILESNLFRDLLKEELVKKLIENNCYRTVTHKHQTENKHIRIMQMEPDITGEKVFFNRINVSFNEQVKDYSKTCANDDAPDALQMAIAKLKKPAFIIR